MATNDLEVGLSDEEQAIREMAHKFAEEVVRPAGIELDRLVDPADVIAPDSILWDVFKQYHELGFGGVRRDTEMDALRQARLGGIISEELAWGDVGIAISMGLSGFHGPWVERTGDAELIERFCAPDSPTLGCWALTEPNHGSDTVVFTEPSFSDPAQKPDCTATRDGDEYVIRGQKAAWVSNGSIADIAVLFCTLDRSQGFSGGGVFLVPLDLPGVTRPPPLDKLGQRSLNQGEIYFDDVRIPASYMALGPEAYSIGLETMLAHGNAAIAQLFVGVSRAAYDHALAYAKERVQGGRPIFEHQSVRSRLFKMFTKVEAARALARRVAAYNAQSPMPSIQHCIAAKTFSTNSAFEVASDAVQIFGGNGLTREYPVEKLLRDARASMIEDGCNELLGVIGGARL
ncbi:MAG: acyl-CoA/acyl-ACP dehydrogenase [Deltaproteobacteria bacterium]|nr:acyl-CoA/acyl-ACP dehydrogenase [Deltaproteobacteria bacterium]MBW2385494.1 acyl-CoA/acyl-ACP dehydrogenase [Deltaproteobacteria bacterium]